MAKVGKAENTAFVNCNLPAWFKKNEMLDRRHSQRLTRGKKSATAGSVKLKGNPR